MTSLLGQCVGLVKNTVSSNPDDSNCNWKSGDANYALAAPANSQVMIFPESNSFFAIRNTQKCFSLSLFPFSIIDGAIVIGVVNVNKNISTNIMGILTPIDADCTNSYTCFDHSIYRVILVTSGFSRHLYNIFDDLGNARKFYNDRNFHEFHNQ